MVIFHSYVSLPEGISSQNMISTGAAFLKHVLMVQMCSIQHGFVLNMHPKKSQSSGENEVLKHGAPN